MTYTTDLLSTQTTQPATVAAAAPAEAPALKGKPSADQLSKASASAAPAGKQASHLEDPLADQAPQTAAPASYGNGLYSHVDFFQPGIAGVSLEATEIMLKSGLSLITGEGQLRSQQITDFQNENASYAQNEKKSIECQAAGALIMGVVGIAACGAGFIKLGYDVYQAKPDEAKIDELTKSIGAKTDELKNPSLTIEGNPASEGQEIASDAISSAVPASDEVNVDIQNTEETQTQPAKAVAQAASDPQAIQAEIKQMKAELNTLQGKQTTYWGKANASNQALQTGINAIGKLGEAGTQGAQAHYACLRDEQGGEKQTTSQIQDAINSTYSQTTQFLGSIINSLNQNLGTVAQMAMRLA